MLLNKCCTLESHFESITEGERKIEMSYTGVKNEILKSGFEQNPWVKLYVCEDN